MATRNVVSASAFVLLGASDPDRSSGIALEVTTNGAGTFSITPKARPYDLNTLPSAASQALAYRNRTTEATTAGSTPITAPGLFQLDTSGLRTGLDVTVAGGCIVTIESQFIDL